MEATKATLGDFGISDSALVCMETEVRALYSKPLLFVYDPTVADKQHGSQGEYSDSIVIAFSVDGPDRTYVIAHELAHALRNSRPGSLQLHRSTASEYGRIAAKTIVSMLEHPSVTSIVQDHNIATEAIFEQRAQAILNARRADNDFMGGSGNACDWSDLAALVEYSGAYKGSWSANFIDLYAEARPRLIPVAKKLGDIVDDYTRGAINPVDAAIECASLMGVPAVSKHFTLRDDSWVASLQPRPAQPAKT